MSKLKNCIFGLTSTLLFTLGFAQTAEFFDPLANSIESTMSSTTLRVAASCTTECALDEIGG